MGTYSILDTRDKQELQTALNKKADKTEIPTTPAEVGADPEGAADLYVTKHNKDADAHIDMREQLGQMSTRLEQSISVVESALGGYGYMKIGGYTISPSSDGHLSIVYTG